MRRIPIRLRLTLAFAATITVVLAATGMFLYLHMGSDLDHSIDKGLRSRTGDIRALVLQADSGLRDATKAQGSRSTDWAQIVDPRLHPVIQMAYASAPQGGVHALPEIYEVRSETAGLMFTNDTLPIKIRDWWAYGVATHVGVGKNNVAS